VTGIDLIREVLVAAGHPPPSQDEVVLRGHAIECRINAEDVGKGFLPAPGLITAYEEPAGPGVRVDSGVRAGDEISGLYDPMIAKLIVHDRPRARDRACPCARRVPPRAPTPRFRRASLEPSLSAGDARTSRFGVRTAREGDRADVLS
jgi:acetyl-CoA/propionyl-CoA carboxylase biotin carboxyl carrier protein